MIQPKLRFSEFDNQWEEKPLSEVFFQRKTLQRIDDAAPLLSFTIEEGVINPENKKTNKRDFLMKDKDNKKFLLTELDDIIYNPANIKFGAIHRNTLQRGVISPIYVTLTTTHNPVFMEALVRRPEFIQRTKKYLEGTVEKLKTLKAENFLKLKTYIPVSLEEEQKIATFLTSVNNVIEDYQEQLDNMKEMKKGMIQKLLSKEVRFKDDNGNEYPAWISKKIGDIYDPVKGAALSKSDISDDGTPLILYGELYTTYNEVAYTITRRTNKKVDEKYYSQGNEVVIPTSGETPEDISTATCIVPKGVILAGDLNIYRSDEVNGQFFSYVINYEKKKEIASVAQGKSVVHIKASDISKLYIDVPCWDEQCKIANCLSSFDTAIDDLKKMLDLWKEMKKGLLQQLFVKA